MTSSEARGHLNNLIVFDRNLVQAYNALATYNRYKSISRLSGIYRDKFQRQKDWLNRNTNVFQQSMNAIDAYQRRLQEVYNQLPSNI